MTNRRLQVHYCCVQGAYWILAAIMSGFMTPILQAKGFSSMEIGVLLAVKHVSSIFVQMWVADFSDRHADKIPLKYIIGVGLIIGIFATGVFYFCPGNFMAAVLLFLIFGSTINIIVSFIDAMSIQYINTGKNISYTMARGCGSFTWAVASIFLGRYADQFGAAKLLLVQMGIAFLLLVIVLTIEPAQIVEQHDYKKQQAEAHNIGYLLKNYHKYTLFLVSCVLTTICYNTGSCFLIDIVKAAGGGESEYGIVCFVLAIVEIPTAVFFMKMKEIIGLNRLLMIFTISNTLKAAVLFFAKNVYAIYFDQIFEMLGFGLFYAGSVFFVMEQLPSEDVVKGTSLITVAVNGIGTGVGSMICGWIMSVLGLKALLGSGIMFGVAGIFIMSLAMSEKSRP